MSTRTAFILDVRFTSVFFQSDLQMVVKLSSVSRAWTSKERVGYTPG